MSNKWHNGKTRLPSPESAKPVPIVGDGAIATTIIGEGRMIPVVIIDTSERSDIEDLVKAHELQQPGDTQCSWSRLSRSKRRIALVLAFERPSDNLLILEFDVARQGILIEFILTAKALYIQPGRKGDTLSSALDGGRILVEVPDIGFREAWQEIWHRELEKHFRKAGLGRSDAREAARTEVSRLRELSGFRMPQHSQETA